jgi:hypothetical protein
MFTVDPVTGEKVAVWQFCQTLRQEGADKCGFEGRWFEPKLVAA